VVAATLAVAVIVAGAIVWARDDFGDSGEKVVTASPRPTSGTATPDVTTTSASGGYQPCSDVASSPREFDAAGGRYAVDLIEVDSARRSVAFDVIQFLVGDAAAEAYHRDVPEDPLGPPGDYYIVNDNPKVRDAPVDLDVDVRLVRLPDDADADLDAASFEELPSYLAEFGSGDEGQRLSNPFWLTFVDGTVTEICEQYVP
jgi:hypothetical protein